MRKLSALFTIVFFAAALPSFAGTGKQGTQTAGKGDPPSLCDSIAGNLVQNCGFETGDFTDWTGGGNFEFSIVTSDSTYVNSGTYGAQLGPVGSDGTLSQTISDTVGGAYSLSFWLYNDNGTPNDFSVQWNGTTILNVGTDVGPFPFTDFTVAGLVGTGSDTLQFSFRQDPLYWGLDDISLTSSSSTVPEAGSMVLFGTALGLAALLIQRRAL